MAIYSPPYQSSAPLNENLMLFHSYPDFSNHAYAFWEYIKENTSMETVWIIQDKSIYDQLTRENIKCVSMDNYIDDVFPLFDRAKYVVFGNDARLYFPKPYGQIDIMLRCTTGIFQDNFLIQPMNHAIFKQIDTAKATATYADLYPVSSELLRATDSGKFFIDARKTFVTGMPRHDPMINFDGRRFLTRAIPQLRQYKKLVIYCPTMKKFDDLEIGPGYEDNIFNLTDFKQEELEELLEANQTALLFKMHPIDESGFREQGKNFLMPKHCYIIDSHAFWPKSLYHVLNAFDIMITDTSSLANEFLLLDRPILYNHAYLDAITAIYQPLIDDDGLMFPGRVFKTSHELLTALKDAVDDPQEYHENRIKLRKLLHKYTDGKSCERIYHLMKSFKPVENMDYEMFTQPLKEEMAALKAHNGQEIAEKNKEISTIVHHYDKHYKLQDEYREHMLAALQNQKDQELTALQNQKDQELAALQNQKDQELAALQNQKDQELAALQNQKEQELTALKSQSETSLSDINVQLNTAQYYLAAMQSEYTRLYMSGTVKFARRFVKLFCPHGSLRRKFAIWLIKPFM